MEDEAIRSLMLRLSRPHPSGGRVIERAAIMAAGADTTAVLRWISEHDGRPEQAKVKAAGGGLHSTRTGASTDAKLPLRFVLPPGALQ